MPNLSKVKSDSDRGEVFGVVLQFGTNGVVMGTNRSGFVPSYRQLTFGLALGVRQ